MTRRLDNVDVDLVLELGERNAPRRCYTCDRDAQYYVYTADVASKYACEEHLDAAVEAARG